MGRLCRLKLFNYQISSRTEFLNSAQTNLELLDQKQPRVFRGHFNSKYLYQEDDLELREERRIHSSLRESSL